MDFNNLKISEVDAMRRTVLRELEKRRNFYPKWVKAGKMTQGKADFEIKAMKDILDFFNWLQIHATPEQQTLF